LRFESWDEAITYLFATAATRNGPIVLDEFPYLMGVSPALPSILQREIDRGVSQQTPITLLLCGSALSVMGRADVARLARARDLLAARGFDTTGSILACYSGAGFEPGLADMTTMSALSELRTCTDNGQLAANQQIPARLRAGNLEKATFAK
jgi:hypothetical protein